jgi:hypothetical protein
MRRFPSMAACRSTATACRPPAGDDHQGEGRYLIEGVRFNMGGWWELRLDISSPAGEDGVTFNLVIE